MPIQPFVLLCDYCQRTTYHIIEGRTKAMDLITVVCQECGTPVSIRGSYLRMLGINV